MWFATEDGLNLYDGYSFTVHRNDPHDSTTLSYNQATVVFEDRDGSIWIGAFNGGLNRYILSRNAFERYRHNAANPHSLASDIVNALEQDRTGSLWIGTDRGLDRMSNSRSRGVEHLFPSEGMRVPEGGQIVRACAFDSAGACWIGTDRGVYRLEARKGNAPAPRAVQVPLLRGGMNPNTTVPVHAIRTDRNGTVWIGTDDGLYAIPGSDTSRCTHIDIGGAAMRGGDRVYALLEDASGTLWIGTDGGGLLAFDRATRTFARYRTDPLDLNSISSDQIRSLYQDRSGLLWIGTYGGGVNKTDVRRKAFRHYRRDLRNVNGLNESIVWNFHEDKDGILWIGTHGGGLNRFDRAHNRWSSYRSVPGDPTTLSSDYIRLVIGDPTGDLWIGTNGGGICRFNPRTGRCIRFMHDPANANSISHNDIRSLYLDPRGVIWIGTYGGGLCCLDTKAPVPRFTRYRFDPADSGSLSNDYVRFVHEDASGRIWIGTQGGGLNRFDRQSGRFAHYRAQPGVATGLNNDYVFCMLEAEAGIFWLGTWGGGLLRFDSNAGTFIALTTRDGLPSNAVYGILRDARGMLWMSTNNGLSRFDPRTRHFKNYTMRDGLQSNEFNGGAYYSNASGEMFFGGINGFNIFRPEEIHDNPHVPPILMTAFRKLNREVRFDRPLSEIREITLSHEDYVFSFEFAALDFTAPEKNLYAYRMDGLDRDWITTTADQRRAQYTTLSPGTYIFRVKGSNNDGIWNSTGVAIRIIILPPFWQTWPFRLALIVVLALIGAALYMRHVRGVRLRAELRAAHDAQMSIMPQQDPSLNGFDVSGLCLPANDVGGDFFDYFRLHDGGRRFGIAVGDVSGKGMRAAMTAVLANGILSAEARSAASPAHALERVNGILCDKAQRGMFTALCLVALDPAGPSMTFSNAGLVRPLLRHGGEVQWLAAEGTPLALGLRASQSYAERTVDLARGDLLVLVTDGTTEAQDRSRNFYGDERLLDLLAGLDPALSAKDIRDAIIGDIQRFTGGASQHDDMTIVVVKANAT